MTPLLDITDLFVTFESRTQKVEAVRGINLQMNKGEMVGLVGRSGCGKSVTAQSIIFPSPSIRSGHIFFEGEDLLSKKDQEMQAIRGKKIGMIFQDPLTSLNPTMRIGSQILEVILQHESYSRTQAKLKTLELMEKVGISDPAMRYNQYPFEFSGGMRQRIMIAIAMACRPALIIADEPTTALDVTVQAQILDLLKNLCQNFGTSLLLITHDLGVVAGLCHTVYVMNAGLIVEKGSVDEIFYRPLHSFTKELLTSGGKR